VWWDNGGGARAGDPFCLAPCPGAVPLPAVATESQGSQGQFRMAAHRRDPEVPLPSRLQHARQLLGGSLLQVIH
jgi:hypothetical protein